MQVTYKLDADWLIRVTTPAKCLFLDQAEATHIVGFPCDCARNIVNFAASIMERIVCAYDRMLVSMQEVMPIV